ncbi:MAG: energy-coupling factor ABC transporter substrate-binding protein [Candidatus Bathyarchaeota archaeon]|nr:energy-coupling factor ABC transporter substrate-binding protein [Candidatus Bathyarchaeum tardum]WGM88747.1 MAG: energy-coupling factor ABC transporter substrate-binding protein [Candidatus Bathyarchaeum tardum]
METKHIIMLAAVVALVLVPLILVPNAEYGGADGAAEDLILETGYEPWFESIWEPPSGEIESLLFVTQAAIGAIIIGYFIGYEKGKRAPREDTD